MLRSGNRFWEETGPALEEMHQPASDHRDPFPSTKWNLVRQAVATEQPGAEGALKELFRAYERPVLAYILGSGSPPSDAEDLKQAFFAQLLAQNALASAEQTGVKLRAFLSTKLRAFLIDHHRRQAAMKRGGGKVLNLAELSEAEARMAEPVDPVTPLLAFQRQWVETLATNAMATLREDYIRRGLGELFDAIAPFITNHSEQRIAELSAQLGRPQGTLKSDISRLRARCQEHIRAEVAETLEDPTPENIEIELVELMGYRG